MKEELPAVACGVSLFHNERNDLALSLWAMSLFFRRENLIRKTKTPKGWRQSFAHFLSLGKIGAGQFLEPGLVFCGAQRMDFPRQQLRYALALEKSITKDRQAQGIVKANRSLFHISGALRASEKDFG